MDDVMGPQFSEKLKQWSFNLGALAALAGAMVILGFVIATYIERDILRVRGVVMAFVLFGLALVVRSEANAYVPVHRNRH